MKKYLLSTVLLGATAVAASAGNLTPVVMETPVAAPEAPAVQAPVANWQGGYLGGSLNYGKAGITGFANDPEGTGLALRGGYDWQNGSTVYGLGAEYDFGEQKSHNAGVKTGVKDAGTVFARLGYDAGEWMPYALAGYTWAQANTAGVKSNLDGYTLGLGVERKLAPNWSGFAELTHTDFGQVKNAAAGVDADLQKIKLGANFRF